MKHGFLMTALPISLILWGFSSASAGADTETSSGEMVKETVQPEIREVSEGSSDRIRIIRFQLRTEQYPM